MGERTDSERLDWLESATREWRWNLTRRLSPAGRVTGDICLQVPDGWKAIVKPGIRAAIDAAMDAEEPTP